MVTELSLTNSHKSKICNLLHRFKPNYFINYPAFNRLHNGAIWQQYEKHQKLASAFYKLAEKTIGKEEADKLAEEKRKKKERNNDESKKGNRNGEGESGDLSEARKCSPKKHKPANG